MAKCAKCDQEFTDQDKKAGNFREGLYGELLHRRCPNEVLKCHVCGQAVAENENVGTRAWPRHAGCHLPPADDTPEADASSWIVRP